MVLVFVILFIFSFIIGLTLLAATESFENG